MGDDAKHAEIQWQGRLRRTLQEGKLASGKAPDIMTDVATLEWGVFEFMNNGTITKELVHLGTPDPSFNLR
jgi:hypothetical protein